MGDLPRELSKVHQEAKPPNNTQTPNSAHVEHPKLKDLTTEALGPPRSTVEGAAWIMVVMKMLKCT